MQRTTHTIPTREDILGVLRRFTQAMTDEALIKALAVSADGQDGFTKRLAAMQRDGQIQLNSAGAFELIQQATFIVGRIQGHRDGFGFVLREDGQDDIFLSDREMQKAMHNDKVQVRLIGQDRRGRPEGQIVEILERANTIVIGRLLNESGALVVAPEDKRLSHDILIAPKGQGKAKIGQVVSVQITHFPDRYTQAIGKVVEVLGDIDDPGMEIEIAVRKFDVPYQFSKATIKEAQALPDKVTEKDCAGRIDLRDISLVTIDGEDARDFDDAVYCEPITQGRTKGWRLLVAIADVSHYVRPGQPLDADALERATSVYFPRRVIPMLPEKISNGLCSLNPHLDRLCMVCDMVINEAGEITAYQFYSAVMHSVARLTYTEVWEALSNTRGPQAHKHFKVMPHLQNLYDLYQVLLKARQIRGAIDFETTETAIICNAQGKIEQILPRQRNDAHKLIEECMLAANVCAADLLVRHHHPALYRIHGGPTSEKLDNLRVFLRSVGLSLEGGDQPHASDYSRLLDVIKLRPDAALLQTMMLRSLRQAVYDPDNIGHFGLAYQAYAHFTSPIRRYPDLLVHRAIKALIEGKKYHPTVPDQIVLKTMPVPRVRKTEGEKNTPAPIKKPVSVGSEHAIWAQLGLHCSANERRADEASRDVETWLKCYFMRDKLGGEYAGTVSGVTSFGLFVQLDELYVEGLIHVTELGSDYFEYDEARNELRGQRTGIRYRLTDRVRVQVSRVDLDARKIDFVLIHEVSLRPGSALGTAPSTEKSAKKMARRNGEQLSTAVAKKEKKQTGKKAEKVVSVKAKNGKAKNNAARSGKKKAAKLVRNG
ncbi:MAG: ribonuclease R [Ottowia sp.]|nr:ribonuclease R [Ottowia sp.]